MVKVTLDRLDQKMDDMKEMLTGMNDEVSDNTKFRHQATGIIGAVSFVCTAAGAGILWIINKIYNYRGGV